MCVFPNHCSWLVLDNQVIVVMGVVAFAQFRLVHQLQPYLKCTDLITMIHVFMTFRMDCCNVLFVGLPMKTDQKLQLGQNDLYSDGILMVWLFQATAPMGALVTGSFLSTIQTWWCWWFLMLLTVQGQGVWSHPGWDGASSEVIRCCCSLT